MRLLVLFKAAQPHPVDSDRDPSGVQRSCQVRFISAESRASLLSSLLGALTGHHENELIRSALTVRVVV